MLPLWIGSVHLSRHVTHFQNDAACNAARARVFFGTEGSSFGTPGTHGRRRGLGGRAAGRVCGARGG